jgi:hypothetical protein
VFRNRFLFHDTELYGKAFELAKTIIFRKQNVKIILKHLFKNRNKKCANFSINHIISIHYIDQTRKEISCQINRKTTDIYFKSNLDFNLFRGNKVLCIVAQ